MRRFQPSRSSTPSKARITTTAQMPNATFTSSTTSSTTLPLSALTEEHVELLDDIISRVSHATTFGAVSDAYNKVLKERGMDEVDDMMYYNFLLKVGLVKGKDWGTRWESVKEDVLGSAVRFGARAKSALSHGAHDHPYVADSDITQDIPASRGGMRDTPRPSRTSYSRAPLPTKSTPFSSLRPSNNLLFETPGAGPSKPRSPPPRRGSLPALPTLGSSCVSDGETSYTSNSPQSDHRHGNESVDGEERDESTEVEDDPTRQSSKPPSYQTLVPSSSLQPPKLPNHAKPKIATPTATLYSNQAIGRPQSLPSRLSARTTEYADDRPSFRARQPVVVPKDERGVNGHDPWEIQDMEKDADDFRAGMLLQQCFSLWRTDTEWIRTTGEQCQSIHDSRLVQSYFRHWAKKARANAQLEVRAATAYDKILLRHLLEMWKQAVMSKRKREAEAGILRRVALIRHSIDGRIMKETFRRWLLKTRQAQMEVISNKLALSSAFQSWLSQLDRLRDLSAQAKVFQEESVRLLLARLFDMWRRRTSHHITERVIKGIVDSRTLREHWDTWKYSVELRMSADQFEARRLLKNAIVYWRARLARIKVGSQSPRFGILVMMLLNILTLPKSLERKSLTFSHRSERLFLRVVWRLWIVRERDVMFHRIQQTQLASMVLTVWNNRLRAIRKMEGLAIEFGNNRDQNLHRKLFYAWQCKTAEVSNAPSIADDHYTKTLLAHFFNAWTARRHKELKAVRAARLARRWFLKRRVWFAMRAAVEDRRLGYKLEQEWMLPKKKHAFDRWRTTVVRNRKHEAFAQLIQAQQEQRIIAEVLRAWILQTIERRDQEMQVAGIANLKLLRGALMKWNERHARNKDRLILLQTHLELKDLDFLQTLFTYWRRKAKHSKRRRARLQQHEEAIRLNTLQEFFGQWKDAYSERRLHDLELEIYKKAYQNVMRSKLNRWKDKTPMIPAIRFDARRKKATMWRLWVAAVPRARLDKRARLFDQQHTEGVVFKKWLAAYRAKMNIKAVARARYFRLPTTTSSAIVPPRLSAGSVMRVRPSISSRPQLLATNMSAKSPAHRTRTSAARSISPAAAPLPTPAPSTSYRRSSITSATRPMVPHNAPPTPALSSAVLRSRRALGGAAATLAEARSRARDEEADDTTSPSEDDVSPPTVRKLLGAHGVGAGAVTFVVESSSAPGSLAGDRDRDRPNRVRTRLGSTTSSGLGLGDERVTRRPASANSRPFSVGIARNVERVEWLPRRRTTDSSGTGLGTARKA